MIRVRNISHEAASAVAPTRGPVSKKTRVRVFTGDVATGGGSVVLEALLGSCVAVCLHDPLASIGGMNHILLPGTQLNIRSTRYGVHAMELLINQLMRNGAERKRLVAKAFGGGSILAKLARTTIGDDNAKFVREFLATERIPLIAQRLGGSQAVNVCFRPDTGRATVRTVDGSRLSKIIHAETSYWRSHSADEYASGEITLF